MNGTVRSLAFADDGQQLLSHGGDGQVYPWDLRTRACIHKAVDEGCINETAICTSPTINLFAAGSDSGIVNAYNRDEFLANSTLHHPRCLDFSPGGGLMAMGNAAGKVLLYKLHHHDRA
ncbi:hypothetical protein POTOM_007431 [Populus tomentosa]|uniref:Uncharacterized protein n=1 Tax=Populus tomentosa TaxID=118781 RepID=A0A8X8DB78_POPTO|nr:hypothetical protein POTOM_007431 [Populus tomentosa]